MREALAAILDAYDARRRGDLEREARARDQDARFLEDFAELRRGVIRPVFETAALMLEERGHRCNISEQESAVGGAGRISEAGITLRLVASGRRGGMHEDQSSLSIVTRHYNRTVWINSGEAPNAGGLAGAKGAHPLEAITRQLVEEELVAFVGRVVAG
jgi:hypothetical protein